MSLVLADANRLANAAVSEAARSGLAISVSICDSRGRLVAHQRMDGVFAEASLGSIGKAIAAAGLGHATGGSSMGEIGYRQATAEVLAEGAPTINARGGLPILQSGQLIGAIGVSGAPTDEQDERCAQTALTHYQNGS